MEVVRSHGSKKVLGELVPVVFELHTGEGWRVHGPRGGRDWSYKLNKKVRRLGMKVALSAKYRETKFAMIENLTLDSHKTSVANAALVQRVGTINRKSCSSTETKRILIMLR